MNKIGKTKRIGLAVTSAVACATMLTAGIASACPAVAMAETRTVTATPAVVNLFDTTSVNVPTECDYGQKFTVPSVTGTEVTVTAPNGTTATRDQDGKVTATQVGNYTVTYTKSGASYDFNVYVTLDEEYFLKVDNNGADIPSYIAKGGSFDLPAASVVYYDENNILRSYPGTVEVKVSDSYGNTYDAGDKVENVNNGKMFITYSATLDGGKVLTQEYTVNVQSTFSDTVAPTLAVSGVSSEYSINNSVKLPTATVSDNFDENVKVEITVVDPDGNKVKSVDIDEYGYAYQAEGTTYEELKFDNDEAMTFYPVKTGTYTITYVAYDDAGNKSVSKVFKPTVKDSSAPKFEDIADYQIPETWGLTVTNASGNANTDILLPIPTLVDNKDHVPAGVEGDENLISLYFRITDTEYSRNIVEIKNVLADSDSDDSKYTSTGTYGTEGQAYSFDKTTGNFTFNFGNYNRTDKSGEALDDKSGSYTVYYRAEDSSGNRSTKTFTIELEDTYTDTEAPTTAEVTVPSYISVADEYINIPSPQTADAKDSNLKVDYVLYSKVGSTVNSLAVDGGEHADIVTEGGKVKLVINKGKTYEKSIEIGDTVYFCVTATDSVGNVKTNSTNSSLTAFDDTNYDTCEAAVKVISSETTAGTTLTYTGSINLEVGGSAISDANPIKADSTVNAGGFKVEISNPDMRKYVGFEVSLVDANGNEQNVTLETYSEVTGGKAVLHVENLTFVPGAAGTHHLNIRIFDVNDNNKVYSYEFEVDPSDTEGGVATQATTISSSGSTFVKYNLHNDKIENIPGSTTGDIYYVVRKINGGRFSLMGSEFIAKAQGSYAITDGYIKADSNGEVQNYDYNYVTIYGAYDGKYTIDVTDTVAPVIDIQGVFPTYGKKYDKNDADNTTVKLPAIVAYSENGSAKVEVTVKDKDSSKVDVTKEADGTYTFKATKDGVYTVTITATRASATPVTMTKSISIGDVIGPEFTVNAPSTRMKVGDTFSFSSMTLASGESNEGVTITKKLIDPSKEEVSSATISGSYASYAEKTGSDITLDKSGTYEVVYTATDAVGNVTTQRYTITVSASGSGSATTFTTLSTVLIIVAVVLLAGVIVYVVRFRKVKK